MIASFVESIGPGWTWILIGLVLMGTELVASGVFLLWLGLAALVTGLQILLVPMPGRARSSCSAACRWPSPSWRAAGPRRARTP
jgi:hypothetical protein